MRVNIFPLRSLSPEGNQPGAAPVQQSERIAIIDSIRGFALLGILLMNIPFFADSFYRAEDIRIYNETSGPNYYTWWVINLVFEGTMRALFSMLFGAGAILLLSRLEKKQMDITPADFYYRRLIWLLVFGVINAFIFLWPGDILYPYALCGLFLYPLRNLKPKYLLILGILVMLVANLRVTLDMYNAKETRVKGEQVLAIVKKDSTIKLSEEQEAAKKKWESYQDKRKVENLKKEVEKERKEYAKGYFGLMRYLKDVNVKIESRIMYDFYFWDILAFLLFGMAFFKWGIFTGEKSTRFYWIMMIAGYGIGLLMNLWYLKAMLAVDRDNSLRADKVFVDLYQERRILQALGHVGLLMLLHKYNVFTFLLRWLSKVGQMAFSNYLMQSLLCGAFFYGVGFGKFGKLERYEWYYVVLAVWIFQVIFSSIWLKYFLFGPFEWLWRSLTYWKKQPMRRNKTNKALANSSH